MARPAYTVIPNTDVDQDSPGKEGDVFQELRDNQNAQRILLIYINFAEQSTPSATYVKLGDVVVYPIPDLADYTSIQRKILGYIDVKTTAGTATFQFRDAGSASTGTEVTTTSSSYEPKEPTIDQDAGWKGTTRTLEIWGKTTSGTCSMQAPTRFFALEF